MAKREVTVNLNVADMPAVKAAILAAYAKGLEDGEARGRAEQAAKLEVLADDWLSIGGLMGGVYANRLRSALAVLVPVGRGPLADEETP